MSLSVLAAPVLAAAPAHLTVSFRAPEGIHFNRRGDSTLTVVAGTVRRTLTVQGVPDPADPAHLDRRLRDTVVALPKGYSGTVRLTARLFLCDTTNGVCTVKEQATQVRVRPGQALTLHWPVGQKTRWPF